MKIEFKIYELTEQFGTHEFLTSNEFIKVGEVLENDEPHYLLQGINDTEFKLIPGLTIQESAYKVPIDIVKLKGNGLYSDWYEFDIPLEYLDIGIVQEIQRLNS